MSVRFLSWECWDFWRRHDHFRRFPKKSEVFRRRPKSAKGEVIEKMLIHKIRDGREGIAIYSFYTWFSFLTWVWVHIFGNCVKQDGNNSHFSIRREKLAHKRELASDRSFHPAGVRLTPKAWELAGIHMYPKSVNDFASELKLSEKIKAV